MKNLLSISLIYAAVALAAESDVDSVKYRFNPIVVTATKIAGAQQDIAASVSVIDEAILSRAPSNSVLEVVKDFVPGVFITERSVMGYGVAGGSAGGVSIRGVGGDPVTGVLVLRDGRPDMMGMMGHAIPDAYALDGVERVEVVRGPASFLYGTNAMGGVINIVSKRRTTDGFESKLTIGGGSFNTQKLVGAHGGKIGDLNYNVTAGIRKTDGHRDFSDYEGDFYTTHLGYDFNPDTQLDFNANLSNLYLFDPGPQSTPYEDHWFDLRRSGADLSFRYNSGLGESNLKVHGNFGRHRIYDGWRSFDFTTGIMFYHNARPWTGNTATVGFDIKRYGGDGENITSQIDYGEIDITEYAPYVHMQQMLFDRVIASAGIRTEHHQLYGYEMLPKLGVVYHFHTSTSVRLSVAKGFRSPTIRELYLFPAPNPDLQPERMWNYELGLSRRIGQRLNFEGALFRARGENLIRLIVPGGVWPNRYLSNSAEFDHSGYEVSLRWMPSLDLEFGSTWTKLDLGDETMNTPARKLTAFVQYRLFFGSIGASLVRAMKLYGSDFSQDPMDDYTLVNLNGLVNIGRHVALEIKLKNALDVSYQTLFGYPMPGRMLNADLILKM